MITSYKQLPVGLYLDICEASQDASMDELAKQVRILALLSGTTDDEILNMPIADYQRAVVASDFLQREYQPSGRCASSYKVGGYDLRPFADWTKMTAAQFIDYQTYAGKGTEPHIVEIVSVVLVPAGKKYGDGYDVADVQRAIRDNLSVADVLDIVAFFFSQYAAFLKDSLTYLKRRALRMKDGTEKETALKQVRLMEARLQSLGGGSTT
jgi:hypothetical protein